jgi:stearoyl-CoA desaturase (delta-9 desaturase)
MLWCVTHDPLGRDLTVAAGDLKKERGMVWLDRYFCAPQVLLAGVLYLLGGWSWVVWGIGVRTVFSYHATWLVNSASHTWGYRTFATSDHSRNNWWVSLISFGEGWHNNHHAHQRSARHGLKWHEFDLTWVTLCVLQRLGIVRQAYAVQAPTVPRRGGVSI